jgi:uncharacterized membrane protein
MKTNMKNIGEEERLISGAVGILGGFLVYWSSRKHKSWALASIPALYLIYRGLTGNCPLFDLLKSDSKEIVPPSASVRHQQGTKIESSIFINRPVEHLFHFWKDPSNLPMFMSHIESVTPLPDHRSHWVARGPARMDFEWDAIIHHEIDHRSISWRTLEGSDVMHAGSVQFKDTPDRTITELKVEINYVPPAGELGKFFAKILGEDPQKQLDEDLVNFKYKVESANLREIEFQEISDSRF